MPSSKRGETRVETASGADLSSVSSSDRPLHGRAGGLDQPLDPGQLVMGRRGVGPLPRGGRDLRGRVV